MQFSPRQNTKSTPARILIVEEEGIIAARIASSLTRLGYQSVGIAESSEEALAKTWDLRPGLILMDIHIKGVSDGIETTAELLDKFDIPVIYLTAHADQQTSARAKTTGASGLLMKPISDANLTVSIEMAINKHRFDRIRRQDWEAKRQKMLAIIPLDFFGS
jgi:CheY-like chemotaxis protein